MPLHNSFKQEKPHQQQGTRLAAVPTTEDLSYALAQASKNKRRPIVLSWKSPKNVTIFWLSVTTNGTVDEAEWLLQKGEEGEQPCDVWMHSSTDTTLIQSLIVLEEDHAHKTGTRIPIIPATDESSNAASQQASTGQGQAPTMPFQHAPNPIPPPAGYTPPPIDFTKSAQGLPTAQNLPHSPLPPNSTSMPGAGAGSSAKPRIAPTLIGIPPAQVNDPNSPTMAPVHPASVPIPQPNHPAQPPGLVAPGQPRQLPPPVELDRVAVDNVFQSLSNPETGLLNHASFLFFLVREFSRFQLSAQPFSLIIADFCVLFPGQTGQPIYRPLPPRAVRQAAQRIFSLTRQLDLVAHYEQSEFAILLPNTTLLQTQEFAGLLVNALTSQPLLPDMEPNSVAVYLGLAGFPSDTTHPGILLSAARQAKNAARQFGTPMMLFSQT